MYTAWQRATLVELPPIYRALTESNGPIKKMSTRHPKVHKKNPKVPNLGVNLGTHARAERTHAPDRVEAIHYLVYVDVCR